MPTRVSALAAVCVVIAGAVVAGQHPSSLPAGAPDTPVTVHEWGTFTTVAGPDGRAQEWLPLGGQTDLPCFVETYTNGRFKVFGPAGSIPLGPLLTYETARAGLKGTVRMETPVLYFYADRDATVNVRVSFPRGLFTEWYPKASVAQLPSWANVLKAVPDSTAVIAWPNVSIRPGARSAFPIEEAASHYYEARRTDAAPLQVNGLDEKFLFYRGVAGFDVPLSARSDGRGGLAVRNLGSEPLPAVLLFTNRNGRLGYELRRGFAGEQVLPLPKTTATFADLRGELIEILTSQGLYGREAEAMINTWRETWFEPGTRVLYIVPKPAVDGILPLEISPAPRAVQRVFVGRMDVIMPEDLDDARTALARGDRAALARHGRLLSVIGDRMLATELPPEQQARLEAALKSTFDAYANAISRCD
jgi:hypothetical protein